MKLNLKKFKVWNDWEIIKIVQNEKNEYFSLEMKSKKKSNQVKFRTRLITHVNLKITEDELAELVNSSLRDKDSTYRFNLIPSVK